MGLAVLLVVPAGAGASQSSDAIAAVNAVRAQVGVAPLLDDPALAADCAADATWMSTHRVLTHEPVVDATPTILDAARHSVLAVRIPGVPQTSAETIPWLRGAPLHLQQLLHPTVTRSGYAWVDGWACMAVRDFVGRPLSPVIDLSRGMNTIHTWPQAGATGVHTAEATHEEMPSPNELIGLPRTHVTGPFLLVFASGFGAFPSCAGTRIVAASITGPGGVPVEVRSSDDLAQRLKFGTPAMSCRTGSGTGFVVPVRPLAANTPYTASVSVVGVGARAGTVATKRTWSFTTGATTGTVTGGGGVDQARPVLRVARAILTRRGARGIFLIRVAVRDTSSTTCRAVVARRAVPCAVRRGVVTLTGVRAARLPALAWTLVVRDGSGNSARLRGTLR